MDRGEALLALERTTGSTLNVPDEEFLLFSPIKAHKFESSSP